MDQIGTGYGVLLTACPLHIEKNFLIQCISVDQNPHSEKKILVGHLLIRSSHSLCQVDSRSQQCTVTLMQDFHWNPFDGKSPHSLNDFF